MGAVNVHSDILIELREYIQQNIIPQYVNFDKALSGVFNKIYAEENNAVL